MYSNRFVMCVVQDGQPVKELGNGVVKLPFGSEYSLRFRNKNNRRAVVQIFIDGENVSGEGYVIPANDFVDIKRHHDVDRSFKFVSLDSADAQDFGKDGPNHDKVKGTIEARFKLEKEYVAPTVVHHHHDHYYPRPRPIPYYPPYRWYDDCGGYRSGDIKYACNNAGAVSGQSMLRATKSIGEESLGFARSRQMLDSNNVVPCSVNSAPLQDGCTVEGASTGQNFRTVHIELEDNETVLKLFLQGFESEVAVSTPAKPKSKRVSDLEEENEQLRRQLAELENEKLKEKLAEKKKPKRKARKKAVK